MVSSAAFYHSNIYSLNWTLRFICIISHSGCTHVGYGIVNIGLSKNCENVKVRFENKKKKKQMAQWVSMWYVVCWKWMHEICVRLIAKGCCYAENVEKLFSNICYRLYIVHESARAIVADDGRSGFKIWILLNMNRRSNLFHIHQHCTKFN